jgi:hypothetical protein
MVIHYQDKQDIIPFVQDVNTLEYELASRIRVMSQEKKKTLFFISNHNEVSPNFIKEGPAGRLFEEFHVEPTQLSTLDSGLTPDAIFLLGPQSKLSEEELSVLDTYVLREYLSWSRSTAGSSFPKISDPWHRTQV